MLDLFASCTVDWARLENFLWFEKLMFSDVRGSGTGGAGGTESQGFVSISRCYTRQAYAI